jgi:hypothetical protein
MDQTRSLGSPLVQPCLYLYMNVYSLIQRFGKVEGVLAGLYLTLFAASEATSIPGFFSPPCLNSLQRFGNISAHSMALRYSHSQP